MQVYIRVLRGAVNPRGLQVPAFAGRMQEPALLYMWVRGWYGLNLLRAQDEKFLVRVSVEPKHMNLISSKIAKHVDVLKLFASIALRTAGPQQL